MFLNNASTESLDHFPNETLLEIFSYSNVSTILALSNVSRRFLDLASRSLVDKFSAQLTARKLGLKLGFQQEYRRDWAFTSDFILSHLDSESGNLVFKPKVKGEGHRVIYSRLIKNPALTRITLNDPTLNSNSNNSDNLLQRSCAFSVKSRGEHAKQRHVYRIGQGSSHLVVPYTLRYTITDLPADQPKTRGGERWFIPESFECPLSFFYEHELVAHQILVSLFGGLKRKKASVGVLNASNNRSFLGFSNASTKSFSRTGTISNGLSPSEWSLLSGTSIISA